MGAKKLNYSVCIDAVFRESKLSFVEAMSVIHRLGYKAYEFWSWREWTKKEWGRPDWNPGQYWFFYGPFGDVTLDLNKVTTSLEYNGNKLPDGATLVQTGNTVKYVNVSSPVGYTYQIFIPATVNYGWGTTSSTLTITVNPNN